MGRRHDRQRVTVLCLLLFVGCGGGRAARDAGSRDTGPVARPSCVVATLSVRDVAEAARAVPSLVGPALPEAAARADARLWMSALADVPSEVATVLAERGDAHVLVLDGAPGRIAWALPLAGRAEIPALLEGDDRAVRRAGRHLVLTPDRATLRAVAPFVERTLARRELAHAMTLTVDAEVAPKAAEALLRVVAAVTDELGEEAHTMRVQMGRAPEIGEPEAVPAWAQDLGRRLALGAGDGALEATVDLSERALEVGLSLDARADTALARDLAARAPGSMELAERIPGDSAMAVVVRRTPAERAAASGRTVALLERLAGPRLAPGEAQALGATLDRWDAASGTQGAFALFRGTSAPTLLLVGEAARPDVASEALREISAQLGRGHLAVVGDRLGLWSAAPAAGSRRGASTAEVAVLDDRVALAIGPDAAATLGRAGPSLAERREVADLVRQADGHLVAIGSASPTALLGLLAPVAGERGARLAEAARAAASSEQAVWSVRVQGRQLRVDARVPPPELRAIASALRSLGE